MENILKSTTNLALQNELNDFTAKIKDLLDLEKSFQGKIAKTEHLPLSLQAQSDELLKSSYETKKQYEQSLYQLYLGLAFYEDASFESFELFHKLSELQSEEEEIPTAPSDLSIDRLIHQMKEKIFSVQKQIIDYRGKLEDRIKVQKILNGEDLSLLLDNMAQKMEHVNHSIEVIEKTIENTEEQIINEVPKKTKGGEKFVFQVKKEKAIHQQRRLWKAIAVPLKQRYRPILSLNLFEECLEENTSPVPPLTRQPSYKTPEQIKQEERKKHAKLHFQNQLQKNGSNSTAIERNKAESFVIVSPELGDWSHVTSPIKPSDKTTTSTSATATSSAIKLTRKDNVFDESLSPLRNALDKVNQLQYTKVVKESATPTTPATPATPATFTLPAKSTPSQPTAPATNSFSFGGATTKPALKSSTDTSKKGFAFDGFDLPTPSSTAEKGKNELPPTGKVEKINRRLALVDDEEGEEGVKGGDKTVKNSLPPDGEHSPINLPSSKKASTNLAGLNEEKTTKDIPSFGQKPADPKATPPSATAAAPVSVIDQIKELYTKYNPNKLAELPKLLQKYDGKHDELYQKLVQKYVKPGSSNTPSAPTAATAAASSQPTSTTPSTNPFGNSGQGLSLFGSKTTPTSTNTPSTAPAPALTAFGVNNNTSSTTASQPSASSLFGGNKSTPTPFSSNATTTTTPNTTGTTPNSLFGNTGAGITFNNTQPINQPTNTATHGTNKFYPIIQEIYQKYNPTKLDEINNLLLKYENKELELIMRLKKKYNITEVIQSEKSILSGMNNATNATTGFQLGSSVFGAPSGGMNMGQTPATNTPSLFGGNNLQKTTPTTPFGGNNANSTATSSGFNLGGASMGMNTPSAAFGATPNANTNTLFGNQNNSNQGGTPFTPAPAANNGFNTPFSTPATSSKSPFAQNQATPFGGGGVGGGNTSLFGQNNNTNNVPAFGQSFANNPAAAGAGNTLFGSNAGVGGSGVNINDVRNRVVQIYQQFNPTKIAEIPKLLEKYQGREQELISKLEQKYGAGNAPVQSNVAATNSGAFGMGGMMNNNSAMSFGAGASNGGNTLFGNRAAPSTPFANQGTQNVGFGQPTPGANTGTSLFGGGNTMNNAAPRGGSVFGQSSTLGSTGGGGFGTSGGGLGSGSLFGGNTNNTVFGGGFRG